MAHDGEKEEKLHRVDQKKGEEKKIETGEGKGGQPAKKAVRGKGNPKHFGRESQAMSSGDRRDRKGLQVLGEPAGLLNCGAGPAS